MLIDRFALANVDVLGLDRFHLVVHDIGGPFEVTAAARDRLASLTALNSAVEVDISHGLGDGTVRRPGIGEICLRLLNKPRSAGLCAGKGSPTDQDHQRGAGRHLDLLRRVDDGRAFLKIRRGFEPTTMNRHRYASVRLRPVPVKTAWSDADPTLKISVDGKRARAAAGFDQIHRLPGSISFREDQAPTLAI